MKSLKLKQILVGASLAAVVAAPAFAAGEADALLTMPTSKENIGAGLGIDAYTQGVQAYVWGYPLVRMERIAREYTDVSGKQAATSYRAPLNRIGWATELATPAAKDMPSANNDTLYMSAVVKLDQPYVLHVPEMNDRYYVVDVFNMWQELEHYLGRRVTGTKPGDYALVPPGWKGELPKGVARLDVTTNKVWLWGRMRVADGESLAPLHKLQKAFTLRPLAQMNDTDYQPKVEELPPLPTLAGDGLGFYRQLAFALKDNPVPARDEALFAQFQRFGLVAGAFDPSRLPKPLQQALLKALSDGPKVAVSAIATAGIDRNGWAWGVGLDSFGTDYPFRALVSGPYLGGQGEKEAMYPLRTLDSAQQPLVGGKTYAIRFKSAPPVDAFWSITAYDAKTKMLVDNPIKRYKIGLDTQGFKVNADGSFDIILSNQQPAGETNWLPTPQGPFYMLMRLYQPTDAVLSGQWQLPQVEEVK